MAKPVRKTGKKKEMKNYSAYQKKTKKGFRLPVMMERLFILKLS